MSKERLSLVTNFFNIDIISVGGEATLKKLYPQGVQGWVLLDGLSFSIQYGHIFNLKTIIVHTNSLGKRFFSQPNKGRQICFSPDVCSMF